MNGRVLGSACAKQRDSPRGHRMRENTLRAVLRISALLSVARYAIVVPCRNGGGRAGEETDRLSLFSLCTTIAGVTPASPCAGKAGHFEHPLSY